MRDTVAAISWISQLHSEHCAGAGAECKTVQAATVVLWGASIGAGFATGLAAINKACPKNLRIASLCLETPFTSIRDMLVALYPQKWVPYKHLWPFLRNHLNSYENLSKMAENYRLDKMPCPSVFLLQAGRDEIVPSHHAEKLMERCLHLGIRVRKETVVGALHNDATCKASGRQALAAAIVREVPNLVSHPRV